MSSNNTLYYPRGRIALDSGDLIDVTNVKLDSTNNAKLVHTLRQPGAGVVFGNQETTISFDAAISEDGPERDYFMLVQKGTVKQLRLKIPGKTLSAEGVFKDVNVEIPLDAEVKQSMTFISGKLTVS